MRATISFCISVIAFARMAASNSAEFEVADSTQDRLNLVPFVGISALVSLVSALVLCNSGSIPYSAAPRMRLARNIGSAACSSFIRNWGL